MISIQINSRSPEDQAGHFNMEKWFRYRWKSSIWQVTLTWKNGSDINESQVSGTEPQPEAKLEITCQIRANILVNEHSLLLSAENRL